MAAPMARWMTVEQFASDSALEHGYYLIDGEVKTDTGTAHSLHEKLKAATARLLILSLGDDARAMVYVDTGFEFNPYTLLIPDVSVLWPDRPYVPRRHFQGSPENCDRNPLTRKYSQRIRSKGEAILVAGRASRLGG